MNNDNGLMQFSSNASSVIKAWSTTLEAAALKAKHGMGKHRNHAAGQRQRGAGTRQSKKQAQQ